MAYIICKCVFQLILYVCVVATIISIFCFPTETTLNQIFALIPSQGLSGVAAPCVDNEPGPSNWQYWAKPHCKERMWCAYANAIRSAEWVERHLTPPSERLSASYSHIILCMTAWSYVFLCLTYMQSRLDAPSCSCIAYVVNVMPRDDFFRKLNKTPSSLFADSCPASEIRNRSVHSHWACWGFTADIFNFCFSRFFVINLHKLIHEQRLSCLNAEVRLNLAL